MSDQNTTESPEFERQKWESSLQFEREKWKADLEFRAKEIALKEREHQAQLDDFNFRRDEARRSRWTNPLVLAVGAAAIAAFGNAAVTWLNGDLQRQLESQRAAESLTVERQRSEATLRVEESKSEAARILEMIKTGNPDAAAVNLNFLVEAGLISEPRRSELRKFLADRQPGQGPSLSAPQSVGRPNSGPDTDPEKLHPLLRKPLLAALEQLNKEGLKFRLFEGYRSPERQNELYAQGATKARPWQGLHEFGLAADLVKFDQGNWTWKVSAEEIERMHKDRAG